MGAFEFLSNDRLVDEVERGLRKGYWDKALIPELKKRFIELEELKRDVARYFELQYKNQFDHMTQNEIHEMYVLHDKLMKVGNEE